MATHSSVLAWRIPGTGEPDGLRSMGSHRVRHDWSDFAAAAVIKAFIVISKKQYFIAFSLQWFSNILVEGRQQKTKNKKSWALHNWASCLLSLLKAETPSCNRGFIDKQGGKIQPCAPFPTLSQLVPCRVLTLAAWPLYRPLRQVTWSWSSISKNLPVVIHTIKALA